MEGRGRSSFSQDCLGYVKSVSTKARPRPVHQGTPPLPAARDGSSANAEAKAKEVTMNLDDMHERHIVGRYESVALSRDEASQYQSHRQRGVVSMCFSGAKGEEQQKVRPRAGERRSVNSTWARHRILRKTNLRTRRRQSFYPNLYADWAWSGGSSMSLACATDGDVIVKPWNGASRDVSSFNVGKDVGCMKLVPGAVKLQSVETSIFSIMGSRDGTADVCFAQCEA